MPDKKPFNIRASHVERGRRVWAMRVDGLNLAQIAEIENISVQRVSEVLKQVAATISPDELETLKKQRSDFIDMCKQIALEAAVQPPKPSFAPNGKALIHQGKAILDYSEKLAALDRLIKLDERFARLTGTDNAVQHTVSVSAEAQQATQDAATSVGRQFALLIPESPEVRAHSGSG